MSTTAIERERLYHGDVLFDDDGELRLPRLTGLAIRMALRRQGVLSRQTTEARALAVADAVRPMVRERGADVAVKHTLRTCRGCGDEHDVWIVRPVFPPATPTQG